MPRELMVGDWVEHAIGAKAPIQSFGIGKGDKIEYAGAREALQAKRESANGFVQVFCAGGLEWWNLRCVRWCDAPPTTPEERYENNHHWEEQHLKHDSNIGY
jgi:hypothetical protein